MQEEGGGLVSFVGRVCGTHRSVRRHRRVGGYPGGPQCGTQSQ